jgi:hypothetical protein
MNYQVNGKSLSVLRLMAKAKYPSPEMTEKLRRLRYMHVGPEGTSVVTNALAARVSLPDVAKGHQHSVIIPHDDIAKIERPAPESATLVELPDGKPDITGPQWVIPDWKKVFPGPERQVAKFTCNGDALRALLTSACEVCEDADKTITLRLCDSVGKDGRTRTLRIDTYTQPGDQSFCGMLKEMEYDGNYIPGEPTTDSPKAEVKPQQAGVVMNVVEGRRFRGEGE